MIILEILFTFVKRQLRPTAILYKPFVNYPVMLLQVRSPKGFVESPLSGWLTNVSWLMPGASAQNLPNLDLLNLSDGSSFCQGRILLLHSPCTF